MKVCSVCTGVIEVERLEVLPDTVVCSVCARGVRMVRSAFDVDDALGVHSCGARNGFAPKD